ncbi:MAG: histidine kinase [Clostridiales bacterium]|nr:histidine kinase [Clostridiales bacterium]
MAAGGAVLIFLDLILNFGFFSRVHVMIGMMSVSLFMAGVTGLSGIYLDSFLVRKGLEKDLIRQAIATLTVLIGTNIALLIIFFRYRNSMEGFNFYFMLTIGNFLAVFVSTVFQVVDHYTWKARKKVLMLEFENKHLKELAQKDTQLDQTIKNLIITQERNEIARELHDSISQGIHGISYSIKSLRKRLENKADVENIAEVIEHLEKTTEATLAELSNMILELKPSSLEKEGLIKALMLHCELFSKRQEIDLKLDLHQIKKLTPEQEFAIY